MILFIFTILFISTIFFFGFNSYLHIKHKGKVIDWYITITATIISVSTAIVVSLLVYSVTQYIEDINAKQKYKSLLNKELNMTYNMLIKPAGMRMVFLKKGEKVLLSNRSFKINALHDAYKSELFNDPEGLMLNLLMDVEVHNDAIEKLNHLLPFKSSTKKNHEIFLRTCGVVQALQCEIMEYIIRLKNELGLTKIDTQEIKTRNCFNIDKIEKIYSTPKQ